MENINLTTLSIFPTDGVIEITAKETWEEADGLFTALGVSPTDFMGTNTTSFKTTYHVDSAEVDISDEDGDAEIEVETDASRLQNLIDCEELELS